MQITPVLVCSQQIARESNIKGVPGEMPPCILPQSKSLGRDASRNYPQHPTHTLLSYQVRAENLVGDFSWKTTGRGSNSRKRDNFFLFSVEYLHFQGYPGEKTTTDSFLGEQPASSLHPRLFVPRVTATRAWGTTSNSSLQCDRVTRLLSRIFPQPQPLRHILQAPGWRWPKSPSCPSPAELGCSFPSSHASRPLVLLLARLPAGPAQVLKEVSSVLLVGSSMSWWFYDHRII